MSLLPRWARRLLAPLPGVLVLLAPGGPSRAEGDAKAVPAFVAGRSGSARAKAIRDNGGNKASEEAVAAGLRFLALHQAPDGHWSLNAFHLDARTEPLPAGKRVGDNSQPMWKRKYDIAGTAFGLLPFLAAGVTHEPPTDPKQPDYSKCVELGLDYLLKHQSQAKPNPGLFGGDMYSHGLATMAVCEAYALTSDPRYKKSAQLGLDYLVGAQDPLGGGWRYRSREAGDLSVTGWQLMALKCGRMAGLTVPRGVFQKADGFLDSCETGKNGGYSYLPLSTGAKETPSMTAVGALCRQQFGVHPRNRALLAGVKFMKTAPPGSSSARSGLYYEYYATQVMFHMGGDAWTFWNLGPDGTGKGGIRDMLISRQDKGKDGRPGQAGSFADDDYNVGGRLGATSLSLLTLQVYYRYPPLYRREKPGE